MKTLWLPGRFDYDGSQIGSGWARERLGTAGDGVAAFVGRCDVSLDHMVDLEDRATGARIFSPEMLHFLFDFADGDLSRAILRQRLFAALVAEEVGRRSGRRIERRRSDLFDAGRKLNVSVATRTSRGTAVHFGVNVVAPGGEVAVPTAGIAEYGIAPEGLARALLEGWAAEEEALVRDRFKVRAVL